VGATIRFALGRDAVATFVVERPRLGVRKGRRCVTPPRRRGSGPKPKRCTRYTKVGSFSRTSTTGANSFRFTGRLRNKGLRRGKYRLTATARVSGGKAGKPATRPFTIVR
jgi:hypothetical protein